MLNFAKIFPLGATLINAGRYNEANRRVSLFMRTLLKKENDLEMILEKSENAVDNQRLK
jgi:hypothetical protein